MNNYQRQIELVLDYIEHHMDSDCSLQTLAAISGFSPYHFHRIFHAGTGKSIHQYVLERKLNCCAGQFLYENCDITRIAADYGFATPSAFSKSFKEQFGCTPTRYKETKQRKFPVPFAKTRIQTYTYDENTEKLLSKVTLPDLQTVCIGITGLSEVWENPEIEKAYHRLFQWIRKNGRTASTEICGITMDTPEVQVLSACRYYACATVDSPVYDEQLAFRTFQTSGTYICCPLNRNSEDFAQRFFRTMDYLYGYSMEARNLIPDYRPFVEFYKRDADGQLILEFCVPVKNSKI